MARFNVDPILKDVDEFGNALFGSAHAHLQNNIDDFVRTFDETHPESGTRVGPDALAVAFVQLSNCSQKLQVHQKQDDGCWDDLVKYSQQTRQTMDDLDKTLKDAQEKQMIQGPPFAAEREEYLKKIQEDRHKFERELQRQRDKIEEYYAKRTRESTLSNLVGAKQQWS
ncbi:predicted protein [Lichtheimia corymbifera JMRC:FSU:9682]|uniref:Biogenesis of lysosome-related organelles complex 1 subunit 5 n=1 Tax=Lichtheimia corymbifera JMRC:FSU:9682 TaxID=1263082 RepID=A0A068S0K0_9FUNG|nr:predicted protein [Lichtheimia corymbifera JMRC:FSU:9682]